MNFSFLHISDIHLGRPFSDLSFSDFDICNRAGYDAFDKAVNFAVSKKADFVLIAGDSFDSEEHDLSAKLCFIKNLKKLADNGIKSYVICGNHDSVKLYKKFNSYFKFEDKYNGLINITGVTTDNVFEIFSPAEDINIYSLSFEDEEMDNPVKYLPPANSTDTNKFNIGLIHCDLDKTDSKYAPVSREELRNLGYDYYALGHIHIPSVSEDKIVYAGTPQARTKKETDEHGCYFVEVENNKIKNIEFIQTDVVRFTSVEVDCSDTNNKMEVFEKINEKSEELSSEVQLLLTEITLTGTSQAFKELNESENLTKEYNDNFHSKKKTVFRINNNTVPYIEENELLQDTGIIGIIMNAEEKGISLDQIYDDISQIHENIYKKLGLDKESKAFLSSALEEDKQEILDKVKKELNSLCSEIYNIE